MEPLEDWFIFPSRGASFGSKSLPDTSTTDPIAGFCTGPQPTNTNTSEQDIPVALVFQAVDLSGGSTSGDRLFFLFSAGCYFRQSFF